MTNPTVAETIAALRARNECFQSLCGNYLYYAGGDSKLDCDAASHLERLQAENERLREVLKSATASLVAICSLLERGGKKAAPSDTMFNIMMDDYRKSIDEARAALAQEEG